MIDEKYTIFEREIQIKLFNISSLHLTLLKVIFSKTIKINYYYE